jgi:hypothetical protein
MLDHHEADNACSDNGMKNNKRLQQPVGPASQKSGFDKISEILIGGQEEVRGRKSEARS